MAYDILNLTNVATTGTTGNQNLGDIIVNTGGIGVVGTGCQVNTGHRTTIDISTIADKYDIRFDDLTYYG
jgi:hypothetical protein